MINQKVMQGVGIPFLTTQPFTDPKGHILREAGADQEDFSKRLVSFSQNQRCFLNITRQPG